MLLTDPVSLVWLRIDRPRTNLGKYNFIYSSWDKDINSHTEKHLFDHFSPSHSGEIA